MNRVEGALYAGGFAAGAASLASLILAGAMTFHEFQAKIIRCYPLSASVASSEKRLLEGDTYACSSRECRLVLKLDGGHGLACYTPDWSLAGLKRGTE